MLTLFAALAELERENIRERTHLAMQELMVRVGDHGGSLPLGYTRTEAGIAIDPDAARMVRLIHSLDRQGYSQRDIGRRVGRSHVSIGGILRNKEVYRGGQIGEGAFHWPAILR